MQEEISAQSQSIPIFTIGHGARTIEQFIALLRQYRIQFLIDVRSQPYSRVHEQFSKHALEQTLKQHEIRYVFMGDTLGGRPADETCYVEGKVSYELLRAKAFYQQGIRRLRTAWEKQLPVVVMCAETKPQECHRSKLIGNTLLEQGIGVAHIDELGELKTQDDINDMLRDKQLSLFELPGFPATQNKKLNYSRKKYVPRASEAEESEE